MNTEQGCIDIDAGMLSSATLTVNVTNAPSHAVASRYGKTSALIRNTVITSIPVTIDGTTLSMPTKGLRAGDCVCWTTYY